MSHRAAGWPYLPQASQGPAYRAAVDNKARPVGSGAERVVGRRGAWRAFAVKPWVWAGRGRAASRMVVEGVVREETGLRKVGVIVGGL